MKTRNVTLRYSVPQYGILKGEKIMANVAEKIAELGIVPVVVLNDAKDAAPLAKALTEGGLPCAEVTFRTEAAEESIRIMTTEYPDMFVGAGTVLTIDQVDRAVAAGAKFIVSPGFDPEIVDYCLSKDIPVFPGIITPSELAQAVKRGLKVVKFFPAEQFGGVATIKALAAPYTTVKFMPTGGVSAKNLRDYLSCDKIIACGGSWMVKGDLVKAGEFDKIRELTAEAVALAKEIRG
jgi:2-dehydro-3-deoxyphosphogluconate aldolase/(4S)-4-hydroxy-2-oxoglutarate aldolase